MDFEQLDRAFFDELNKASLTSPSKKVPAVSEYPDETLSVFSQDRWMSWREWHWRMTDKIFDDDRRRRGLRPVTKETREKSIERHLRCS